MGLIFLVPARNAFNVGDAIHSQPEIKILYLVPLLYLSGGKLAPLSLQSR